MGVHYSSTDQSRSSSLEVSSLLAHLTPGHDYHGVPHLLISFLVVVVVFLCFLLLMTSPCSTDTLLFHTSTTLAIQSTCSGCLAGLAFIFILSRSTVTLFPSIRLVASMSCGHPLLHCFIIGWLLFIKSEHVKLARCSYSFLNKTHLASARYALFVPLIIGWLFFMKSEPVLNVAYTSALYVPFILGWLLFMKSESVFNVAYGTAALFVPFIIGTVSNVAGISDLVPLMARCFFFLHFIRRRRTSSLHLMLYSPHALPHRLVPFRGTCSWRLQRFHIHCPSAFSVCSRHHSFSYQNRTVFAT